MTLIGDTKKEDALEKVSLVQALIDGGTFKIDPSGTWNMRLKGISIQYWPTKGRWSYTCPKLIARAKAKAIKARKKTYGYETSATQFGGGIDKFIQFLQVRQ